MGLKDVVERITGKKQPTTRGVRGPREPRRTRDEATGVIQTPDSLQHGPAPAPPAPPQASAPPAAYPPAAAHPAARAPAAATPPAAPSPAPAAPPPAPAPAAAPAPPPPAAHPAVGSSEETMYMPSGKPQTHVTAVLVGIEGELVGKLYAIGDGENKLGRAETCDVILMSPTISREHANIVHQDGVFAILPLSDKNHTYLNDELVEGCEIGDGDKLRMGRSTFRFRTIEGP